MRFYILFLILLILLIPVFSKAQDCRFSFSDSVTECRIRKDIAILASDSFMGRRSGTRGERMASEYISMQFRQAGLIPIGSGADSFLQPFQLRLPGYVAPWIMCSTDDRIFKYREDFGITAFSGNGSVAGKVLDLDIADLSCEGREDVGEGIDLKGKIVLIGLPEHSSPSPENQTRDIRNLRKRMETFCSGGAVAIMLWNTGSPLYRKVFEYSCIDTLSCPVIFISKKAVNYIHKKPDAITRITVTLAHSVSTYYNVAGYIDNGVPSTVVFGAHYDHLGKTREGKINYGADDNASGTAMVMELSRYLASDSSKQSNYLFIAFSAEEEGLLGSKYFCTDPDLDLGSVKFMFNFDMVGRLGWNENEVIAEGVGSSSYWKHLYKNIPHPDFRLKKVQGALPFSDEYYFYTHHIPVLYLTTGLPPQYHTPEDVPARVNYKGMVDILSYSKKLSAMAEKQEKIPWKKVSGLNTALSYLGFAIEFLGNYFGY